MTSWIVSLVFWLTDFKRAPSSHATMASCATCASRRSITVRVDTVEIPLQGWTSTREISLGTKNHLAGRISAFHKQRVQWVRYAAVRKGARHSPSLTLLTTAHLGKRRLTADDGFFNLLSGKLIDQIEGSVR